ncbi:MAG: SpoIID/LytB domain-containing protein [Candidatus Omnitrophica bacterium]|nr:SpoIID/LytB domain-containing protein [Candidatus Omnitrophota bacterium]
MKKILLTFFFVAILLGAVGATAEVVKHDNLPRKMVRVAIVRDARELNLTIEGFYSFIDPDSNKVISKGHNVIKARVRLLDKGLFMGMNVYPVKHLLIKPNKESSISINNHSFRGDILIMRTPNNRITAINSIDIEDYIKGVMYHEVSHHWAMEALKAQAVATRTYALYKINSSHLSDYDVTNDIYSQVYGGKDSERYRTGLAVDRTAGQILTYQNKILPAYFHATCGGMTEDAKELWDIDIQPLRGVPCMFCQDSPHMHWKKNYRLRDIQLSLIKNGFKMDLIKDISILERDRSERIKNIKITSRDGHETIISGKDFREIIGPNDLKSNNYEITLQGYFVTFTGKGWGHGVGMCQWGARGMADQQFNYKQILAYYYPNSQMMDYHNLQISKLPFKEATPSKFSSSNK